MTDALKTGELVGGRYEVRGCLGEGGQATVYRVFDKNLEVERALKIIAPDTSRQEERLDREIRIMSNLAHPALLKVVDVGQHDDRTFLIMPLLEEGSLGDLIAREGPLDWEPTLEKFANLLEGLEVVHQQGIVHRDIKPPNLLLRRGALVLADFGIARDAGSSHTRTGIAMGTLEYMAPEQHTDAARVTSAADIYAVGSTLFNATTGQSPVHLFLATREEGRLAALPPQLRDVIWRATRMEPHRRYASALEMAEALRSTIPEPAVFTGRSKNKICMLGASGVGKTSLVSRFVHSMFSEDYRTTIGVQIERKELEIYGQKRTCVLWDLEGEDAWARTRLPMMRGAHGFVVVVDGTRRETALTAARLLEEARQATGPRPYAVLLNKADRAAEWTIRSDDLVPLISHASAVFRTSAKSGRQVDVAFRTLVQAIE